MQEINAIIEAFKKVDFSKRKAALATVVRVKGSSYRAPGARMLITDDGKWIGSISGGCLEGDALRKARSVMRDRKPMVVTYDTSDEENRAFGISLGCNGVIDVLIEALDSESTLIKQLQNILVQEELSGIATVFESGEVDYLGEKLFAFPENQAYSSLPSSELKQMIHGHLLQCIAERRSSVKNISLDSKSYSIFFEVLEPTIDLLIIGGGFDVKPVAELAYQLGWKVSVFDECPAHTIPINFPSVDHLIACNRKDFPNRIKVKKYSAAILMSHNYGLDLEALNFFLNTPISYIGMLGPKKRLDRMLEEGLVLKTEDINRLHAPIGLDIGAETPQEIAISIIGEIRAKFSNANPKFLKDKNTPIHQRQGEESLIFKPVFQ
ncbi:MAG: XdhC family protein [Bacteroidota bacterium]